MPLDVARHLKNTLAANQRKFVVCGGKLHKNELIEEEAQG